MILAVFALYKYDIWWLKNKLKKQPLNDYDKTGLFVKLKLETNKT